MNRSLLRLLNWENKTSPAFSARLSAGTTITAGNFVKAQFGTEDYDLTGDYDATTNFRFQPSVPGIYNVKATIAFTLADTKIIGVAVYKNGSVYKQTTHASGATAENASSCSWDVAMNGTTDYLEIFAFNGDTSNQNLATAAEKSHFSAHRVCGLAEI